MPHTCQLEHRMAVELEAFLPSFFETLFSISIFFFSGKVAQLRFGSDLCAALGIDFLSFTPRCLLPLHLGVSCTGWPVLICVFQVEPVQILPTWAWGMFVGFSYKAKAIVGPGGPSDLSTLLGGRDFCFGVFFYLQVPTKFLG